MRRDKAGKLRELRRLLQIISLPLFAANAAQALFQMASFTAKSKTRAIWAARS
jgi:hypothetical protein